MTLKENMTFEEVSAYETPSVTTLEVQREGVLSGSYDLTHGGGCIYCDYDTNDNGDY